MFDYHKNDFDSPLNLLKIKKEYACSNTHNTLGVGQ